MSVEVHAPNPRYQGERCGVRFHDGVGVTDDPRVIARLRRAGYRIVTAYAAGPDGPGDETPVEAASDDVADDTDAEVDVPEPPAGNASQADWAAWAVEHGGLDWATAEAMTRDELRAAYAAGPDGPGD